MKVLFVWFNVECGSVGMSIGMSLLSAEVRRAGHDVRVLHLNEAMGYSFDLERLRTDFLAFDPDVLALSFGSSHWSHATALASAARRWKPGVYVLCGGIHTTLDPDAVMAHPAVNAIGVGECDGTLVQFLEHVAAGKTGGEIPGFWYRSNGSIHRSRIGVLPDISKQSFLDFEGIDYFRLTQLKRGFAEVAAGRGCPWRCTYCQNNALRSVYDRELEDYTYCRWRDPSNLIEELHRYQEAAKGLVRAVIFADDTFVRRRRWLREFAGLYRREIGLPFSACVMASSLKREETEILADAGAVIVRMGIETASEKVRKGILRKPLRNEHIERSVNLSKRYGLNVLAYAMIGLPGDTPDSIQDTFRYFASLGIDIVHCVVFHPFPGTELHRYCQSTGLIDPDRRNSSYYRSSVLRWPESMHLFIEKTWRIFPWLLNGALPTALAGEYHARAEKAYGMSRKEWEREGQSWFAEQERELAERSRRLGTEHYFLPLPERPDAAFLYRERERKLPNIDEPRSAESGAGSSPFLSAARAVSSPCD